MKLKMKASISSQDGATVADQPTLPNVNNYETGQNI